MKEFKEIMEKLNEIKAGITKINIELNILHIRSNTDDFIERNFDVYTIDHMFDLIENFAYNDFINEKFQMSVTLANKKNDDLNPAVILFYSEELGNNVFLLNKNDKMAKELFDKLNKDEFGLKKYVDEEE